MPTGRRWCWTALWSLCWLGLLAPAAVAEEGFDALRAQALATGAARVIVRLREGHVPETWLGAAQQVDQRLRIAHAQARVLERVAGGAGAVRFQTLPYLALELSAEDLDALQGSGLVEEIRPDRVLHRALIASVPHLGAPVAWASGAAGSGQVVAILDDGVDSGHSFLAGKVVAEACFLSPGGGREAPRDSCATTEGEGAAVPPPQCDNCDHGTHVAGIAAGRGNDFSGVARDADLIAVRMLDSRGLGMESDLVQALEYVYGLRDSHSVAAINMSLSGELHATHCDERGGPVRLMFEQLRAAGIAPVVATGNNAVFGAVGFPSCLSSAIAVGATERAADTVAFYSNNAAMVDLLAPGGLSSAPIVSSVYNRGNGGFSGFYGTSMAAPHAAGALAVMRSRYPDADLETLLLWLKLTGLPVGEVVAGNEIVNPRIRLEAAIEAHLAAPDAPTYERLMGSADTGGSRAGTGGCTLLAGRPDPLLPALLMLALLWLWRRRV